MHNVNFKERRGAARIYAEIQVRFTLNGKHDVSHQGISQNLSESGLYMTTNYCPKIGDSIELLMNLDGKRLQSSITEGTIVRSKLDKKNAQLFHVSVAFTHPYKLENYDPLTASNLF